MTVTTPFLCMDIKDTLLDALNLALEKMGGFLQDTVGNLIGKWIYTGAKELIDKGAYIYNVFVNKAYSLLVTSPASWAGDGWDAVEKLNNSLMILASTLVCIFFLIGYCKESLDVKQEIRIESILKMFMKLSIAEFFVTQSLYIVCWMFDLVNYFTQDKIGAISFENFSNASDAIVKAQAENGDTYPFDMVLVALLIALVFFVTAGVVSVLIFYQALMRMFKIITMIPLGTLASATIAGDHQLSQSAVSFYKYALNCVLEAGEMIFAMALYVRVADNVPGLIVPGLSADSIGDYSDFSIYMVIQILLMITLYGAVKQASEITRRALSL